MMPFPVIMIDEDLEGLAEVTFAQWHYLVETLRAGREQIALGVGFRFGLGLAAYA